MRFGEHLLKMFKDVIFRTSTVPWSSRYFLILHYHKYRDSVVRYLLITV